MTTGRIFTTAVAVTLVVAVAGCASSARRMPPAGPAGLAPVGYAAPMPTAPTAPPSYAAPLAPPPLPTAPPLAAAPLPPAVALPAPAQGIAGLTERKPDLCGAGKQSAAIGQPGSAVAGLGLTEPFRIVEYRGIEPQDYDPYRMVFRLDATGTIANIDCG